MKKRTPFGTIGKSATYWAVLTGTIVGIAGAFGLVGVFSLISVFHSEIDFLDNAYDFTKLFGVSVLGGYIARTALPQLGTAMTQRVLNAEKQIEEAASKISHSTDQIKSTSVAVDKLNDSLAMEKAKNALFLNKLTIVDDNVWKQAAAGIKAVFNRHKGNREAAIVLARFLTEPRPADKSPPDYKGAITVLSEFLSTENKSNEDESDVLCNRSYYSLKLSEMSLDGSAKSEWLDKSLRDLRRSVDLKEGAERISG